MKHPTHAPRALPVIMILLLRMPFCQPTPLHHQGDGVPQGLKSFYHNVQHIPDAEVNFKLIAVRDQGVHAFASDVHGLRRGDAVLSLPESAVITRELVLDEMDDVISHLQEDEAEDSDDDGGDMAFVLYIMSHIQQGNSSHLNPWLSLIPASSTSPLFYSDQDWEKVAEGTLGTYLRIRYEQVHQTHQAIFPRLCRRFPVHFPRCTDTWADFRRAYCIVSSRLYSQFSGGMIVPALDLLHAVPAVGDSGENTVLVHEGGRVILYASADLGDSSEIVVGIGRNQSDVDLLWSHGITTDLGHNPHNYAILQLDSEKLTPEQIQTLRDQGVPTLTFTYHHGELPTMAIHALQVLSGSGHEREELIDILHELLTQFEHDADELRAMLLTSQRSPGWDSDHANEVNFMRLHISEQEIIRSAIEALGDM